MKKYTKGFSLVELLVAMAIIAVLISIAAFGIQIVQRNARDTRRRKVVEDMQLVIADIQTGTPAYPESITLVGSNTIGFIVNGQRAEVNYPQLNNNINNITNALLSGGAAGAHDYEVKGFNALSITTCPTKAGDPMPDGIEKDPNAVTVCYDAQNLVVGVKLEGSEEGYSTGV